MKMTADNIAEATARSSPVPASEWKWRTTIIRDWNSASARQACERGAYGCAIRAGRLRRFVLGRLPTMTPAAARKAGSDHFARRSREVTTR